MKKASTPEQTYGYPQSSSYVFPSTIVAKRAPTNKDIGHPVGQIWVYEGHSAYNLIGIQNHQANWVLISTPTNTNLLSFTENNGTHIYPYQGNVSINATQPLLNINSPYYFFSIPTLQIVQANTTDASPTGFYFNIFSTSMPSAVFAQISLSAYNSTTGGSASYNFFSLFYFDGTNAYLQSSIDADQQNTPDMAGITAVVAANSTFIEVNVTGLAANNIAWTCIPNLTQTI